MKTTRAARFPLVLLCAALAACGGGGSGDRDNTIGGIDRGGITIAQGPITAFGSVYVNGVRYDVSATTITVDDQPGTESDLRVGQVVRISGTLDASGRTGTARTLDFDDLVEGPIDSIDLPAQRLVVLGQTVQTGAGTSFDDDIVPRSIDGLRPGDRVEVSGLVRTGGVIDATRIELEAAGGEVEVQGRASAVDTAARRLAINGLTVDYSAAQLEGFPGGQPGNGELVEARGTVSSPGVLAATRLERKSESLGGALNAIGEIEGLVTRYASTADFDVAGQPVSTTATTTYQGGTAADVRLNANIEVEGRFDAAGRLVATKVEFRRDSEVELSGPVEAVNAAAGTFVVLGTTVLTNTLTRYEDQSAADLPRFGLADLRVGDFVDVRAYRDGATLVATLLERDDPEDDAGTVELQGIATDVAPPSFKVGGLAVTTDGSTEFQDKEGAAITAAGFFAAASGREVKVRGARVGDVVVADEAELED